MNLIKSNLASKPLNQMSLLRVPKAVANKMERLQRDFLWGGGVVVKKPHLVNWEVVCSNKGQGGLGIRNLSKLNKVLPSKWVWRFATKTKSTWRRFISVKFGEEDHGCKTREAQGPFGVGVWKEILRESIWVSENWKFIIGNGSIIKFWTDHWRGSRAL